MGSEGQHESKLSVVEMKMLCWINENTRRDRINNESIRGRVMVVPIVKKTIV